MTHTPGPWTVPILSVERPSGHDVRPTVAIRTPQGQMLLSCSGLPARGEMQANARLIAAAPELLEAAERADQWLDVIAQNYPEMVADFHPLRAAIAQAKGTSSAQANP